MLAEIADNLQHTLLHRGGPRRPGPGAAQEPLASQAKDGIIFGRGPGEITAFCSPLHFPALSSAGAHPEPGQDDVDSQVGDPLGAEQWLGTGHPRGTQGPMCGPELVPLNLENL